MDVVILVLIYLIDKIINALEIKLSTLAPHLIISLILVSLRNVYTMKTITLKSNRMSICTEDSHKPTNHYGSPLQCNTTIKKSLPTKKIISPPNNIFGKFYRKPLILAYSKLSLELKI